MSKNKRIPVKWIRDKAKAAYQKKDKCYICSTTKDLELHHLNSVTYLFDTWVKENDYCIHTDEDILEYRDEFISLHKSELYDQVYTLCVAHHAALHGVFGKTPLPSSVKKQERWIEIQKGKITSSEEVRSLGTFAQFY